MTQGSGGMRQVREMQRTLTGARDQQIARVVAVVDALADRSAADALIAPLRPRLMQLRPPRPLRLARLLFVPLDPLVVPAARWRPGDPLIPRTALTPLADALAAAGPVIEQVRSMIEGRLSSDARAIAEAGALLWPAASRALLTAAPPASWAQSGLREAEFTPIARGVAGALENATLVQLVLDEVRQGLALRQGFVSAVLDAAGAHGPDAWSMTLAVLLARLPDPMPVIRHLAASPSSRPEPGPTRVERVTETLLNTLHVDGTIGPVAESDLAGAGAEVRRIGALFDALDAAGASPQRRQRLHELRCALDSSSRSRFEAGIAGEFVAPLEEQLQAAQPVDVASLEAAARGLRQLEAAGRRIGSAKAYDGLLERTAEQVRRLDERPGLTLVDKVRMVEVLAGSDAAMAMLSPGRS